MIRIFKNKAEFHKRVDKAVNGYSQEFVDNNEITDFENIGLNIGCWNCEYCINCEICSDCKSCKNCVDCVDCVESYDCNKCVSCNYCKECIDCYDCHRCYCLENGFDTWI